MGKGYVYLVGAGPGDPKLLTIKGAECIAKADVLVYDRLVSRRILQLANKDCERIYVGKLPDRHILRQEEINVLLVKKALEGKIVTRLKGGDPFVFGRGGEEAEELVEAGIPYEIVPGITSAVSVPAYAGIPVTHRDITSSFTVITGHEDPNKNQSAVHWEHLAKNMGTLVFLMGMENLDLICQRLIEYGLKVDTPVGIIEWGTRCEQRTVTGNLENIKQLAEAEGYKNPAVIIVGQVVSLRQKLRWMEKRPLFGKRIIVTRSRHQASMLSQAIEDLGGEAWEFPSIELVPPSEPKRLQEAVRDIQNFHWLIFTSVNGVEAFFTELTAQDKDIRELSGINLAAIGPATKAALESRGLRVAFVPEEYIAEKVAEGLNGKILPGERILLARAEEAREILPELLKKMGADVSDIPVYKTVPGMADKGELLKMLQNRAFHAITFTSSSTVRNFIKMIDGNISLLDGIQLYTIGPITTETVSEFGLSVFRQADNYTIQGLLNSMVEEINH
ncbi:MAG: Uroporphyrinogen-III C-methyltransferase [Candidatus Dichloromethanomonas elyunquensis]|nr:MAG: Uroporphyrinogen-III C-methyltransferase [Candidatus Dichloromethanomonas elyunquensis]